MVLKQYEPRNNYFHKEKPGPWITPRGRVVLDINDNPVLAYDELPATISSEIEAEFLIAFHRLNHHISMPDIRARMMRNPTGKPYTEDKDPIRTGNLSMRMTRYRERAGMFSWTKRAGTTKIKSYIDTLLPRYCRAANSIANFRDLHPHEIAKMRLILVGKHPERTRGEKDYSKERKQKLYNEQLRRYQALKARFDQEQQINLQRLNRRKRELTFDDTESDDSHIFEAKKPRRGSIREATTRGRVASSELDTKVSLDAPADQVESWMTTGENRGLTNIQSAFITSNASKNLRQSQSGALALDNGVALTSSYEVEQAYGFPYTSNMTYDSSNLTTPYRTPSPTNQSAQYTPSTSNPYSGYAVQEAADDEWQEATSLYHTPSQRPASAYFLSRVSVSGNLDNNLLLQEIEPKPNKRKRSDSNGHSSDATSEEQDDRIKRRKRNVVPSYLVAPSQEQAPKRIAGLLPSSLDPALFLDVEQRNSDKQPSSDEEMAQWNEQGDLGLWYTNKEELGASSIGETFPDSDTLDWIQSPEDEVNIDPALLTIDGASVFTISDYVSAPTSAKLPNFPR